VAGPTGATGATGSTGPAGPGLPAGGTAGQIIIKNSTTDYDTYWSDNIALNVETYVKNGSGVTINKGEVVYVSGSDGTNIVVDKARADSDATSATVLGFAKTTTVANGFMYVVSSGNLTGTGGAPLNTSTASAGDSIWLSPTTAGAVIYGNANKPVAPYHSVYLGVVTRINSNTGEYFASINNGYELDELHNVLITGPAAHNNLIYDSASSIWKNQRGPAIVQTTTGDTGATSYAKIYTGDATPASPTAGDLWIDSTYGSGTSNILRWRKVASGGETTISGTDANGTSLVYTPGYEELYINGVLQYRGSDYVATTGTTITGLTALVVNDTVEVVAPSAAQFGDYYTQSQADAKYVNKTVGGMSLIVPTGAAVSSGSYTLSANGNVTFTGANSISLNGCFTSAYDNYQAVINVRSMTASPIYLRYRSGGADNNLANYSHTWGYTIGANTITSDRVTSAGIYSIVLPNTGQGAIKGTMNFYDPQAAYNSVYTHSLTAEIGTIIEWGAGAYNGSTSFDGFSIIGSNMTGTIRIYGYNNGA
jgi:hypothetical protein